MPIRNSHNKSQNTEKRPSVLDKEGHASDSHDESNWLVSYADMMTLLCGFFILLFSMSKLDAPEYDSFKEALAKQFGGEYVSPTKEMAKFTTEIIKQMGLETTASVKYDAYGISIIFESTVFFETMSANVSPKGKDILNQLISAIKNKQIADQKIYRIVVEGHSDSRPVVGGLYPSNWELSGARAGRVVRMFLDQGFQPNRLTAIGYADVHPHTTSRTPAGSHDDSALAKNRRVVLRILDPKVEAIPFPDTVKPMTLPSAIPSVVPSVGPAATPSTVPSTVPAVVLSK